jgi:hypothetical protein
VHSAARCDDKTELFRARTGAWALALIAVSGCGGHAPSPTALVTESNGEVHDGTLADMALPTDAAVQPDDARGWIAQGRVRAAIRMSDGRRMDAENEQFSAASGSAELVTAIALDEAEQRLYTLTDGALYREDLAGPSTSDPGTQCTPAHPGNRVSYEFASTFHDPIAPALLPDEQLLDVKRIPRADGQGGAGTRLLVLTSHRMLVVSSDSAGLTLQSQCLELYDRLVGHGPHFLTTTGDRQFDELQVDRLVSVALAVDHTGATIAYVMANMGKYAHSIHGSVPLLMLCDLDAGHDFAHPTFDVEAAPDVGYAYWDSFEADPAYTGTDPTEVHEHSLHDLSVRVAADETDVYLACGRQKQLRCVSATFAPGGILPRSTITLDESQDLELVLLAAQDASRLYVRGSSSVFSVDLSTSPPSWTSLDGEPFGGGAVGSPARVLMASGRRTSSTFWTMGAGPLHHNVQAFDVLPQGPTPSLGLDLIWRCDGGVALAFEDTYVLTGGGVRHYHFDGSAWLQAGYSSSEDPTSHTGITQGFAEQLDVATLAPGDQRLLGPLNTSAESGLIEWRLDASRDPLPGSFYPIARTPTFSGWDPGDQMYTDDLAFLNVGGEHYAVLCPTRQPAGESGTREAALVVFRWLDGHWIQAASARAPLGAGFANTIALADLDTGDKAAFVATDAGVLSFALRGLAEGQPTVTLMSVLPGDPTWGAVASGSRLIVAYTHGVNPRYVLYDWDTSSGAIVSTGSRTFAKSALQLPGSFGRTFRLRFDPLDGPDGAVYDCNDAGQVFRLQYHSAGEGSLEYDARWHSLDQNAIQDCRVYTFDGVKRLLVTKDREAFAWVIP